MSTDNVANLEKIPIFSGLNRRAIWCLSELFQTKTYQAGDILVKEGGKGSGLFILVDGSVDVIRGYQTEKETTLTQLGGNEVIGEISIIDELPHTATIIAAEAIECLHISEWDFKAQLQAYPEIAIQLLPIVVRRLRESYEKS